MTGQERVGAGDRGTTNVLLAGVGGQGVLVASETLALAALAEGLGVKQSEVHGVAQRGGSVVSHVRFGPRVNSPLVRCGEAHALYAGEQLEALRYAHYLEPGGLIVMDDRRIEPIRLSPKESTPYPQAVPEFLLGKGYEVRVIPALQMALDLGNQRCANVVLLGLLSTALPLAPESWQTALQQRFPASILELNLKAFAEGRESTATRCGIR
jgi:indolepyruvate ferredoxin oxidoreductase beta subunit